jgi:hypothetical protein
MTIIKNITVMIRNEDNDDGLQELIVARVHLTTRRRATNDPYGDDDNLNENYGDLLLELVLVRAG